MLFRREQSEPSAGWCCRWVWAAALVVAAGCDDPAKNLNKPTEPLNGVATVYPLADVLRQIGGRWINVEWVIESGGSLDAIQPSQQLLDKLGTADIRAVAGNRLKWTVDGFDDPMRSQNILRLDLLEPARNAPESDQTWLDPEVIKAFARAAAEKMVVQRPERTRDFRAAADVFVQSIDSIIRDAQPALDKLKGKRAVVLDNDFTALTRRLGIEEVLPVGIVDPSRVSDSDARRIRDSAKQSGVRWLLLDDSLPLGTRDDLAARTGLSVITLDSLGTSSGVGRSTFQAILKFNLAQLQRLAD